MKNGLNFNKDKYNLAIATTTSLVLGTAPFTLNANANEVCTVSNLNQLQIAALNTNCNVINVSNNIKFDRYEDENQTIFIDHNVLIQGDVTIDGANQDRIFSISHNEVEPIDVTIKNLNLINGAGPIINPFEAEPDSEDTSNNFGGAVGYGERDGYLGSVNLVLDGVTFTNNSAMRGGAISLYHGSTLDFEGNQTTFSDNYAIKGGAIYSLGNVDLSIDNQTQFHSNSALYGGAVYIRNPSSISISAGTTFEQNSAWSGGAILTYIASFVQIENSAFIANQATTSLELASRLGIELSSELENSSRVGIGVAGAINSYYQNNFEIQNATFFNNSASTRAGAISADNYGDHEIVFSTFLDNEVKNLEAEVGQSIYATRTSGLQIFGNIFASNISNKAQLSGANLEDFGGNLLTSQSDEIWLTSPTSRVVSVSTLGLATQPQIDPSYLDSAPVIAIESDSIAADAVDLDVLITKFQELNLSVSGLTTRDQRGFSRRNKYDSGAYEFGERTEKVVVVVSKVVLPAAPSRLSVKSEGRRSIKIQWSKPTTSGTGKILRYEVYRNNVKIATVPSTQFEFRDKQLDPNQSYSYRLVTIGTQGKSIKSKSSPAIFPRP